MAKFTAVVHTACERNQIFKFDFQGNVNQEQKSKCVWLFGYAACVWEEWDQFGTRLSIDRQEQKIDETSRAIERFRFYSDKIKKITYEFKKN